MGVPGQTTRNRRQAPSGTSKSANRKARDPDRASRRLASHALRKDARRMRKSRQMTLLHFVQLLVDQHRDQNQ